MGKDEKLHCEKNGLAINITIGMSTLRFATENNPDLVNEDGEPSVKISDESLFMKEVVHAINKENEDGSTLLTDMLDEAVSNALDSGCYGIDHEAL